MAERLSEERLKRIASYGDGLEDPDSEPAQGADADPSSPDTSAHIYDAVAGSAILATRWRKRKDDAARQP